MRDINNLLGCIGDFYIPFQGNDIHVIGTLTRYDENISLECRTDQGGTVLFESKGYHQIYGNIAGTDVTLLGSHISRMRLCGTNISQTILTITPSAIVLGRSSKEKIKAKAISSNMKDFNQMFADSALTSNILFTRENPSLVQFAFPENITATDNDGELTIKRSFDLSQRHDGIEIQITRIIKTISKGVVFIISPSFKRLYRRSSYLRYNQYKHCGFVSILLQLDWFEVTQTTVTCLNW